MLRGIRRHNEVLLYGGDVGDDAAVIKLGGELIVQTVDVIAPVTDDPFLFGQIAAANALSDVFAVGADVITALNIAFFPTVGAPIDSLRGILQGAQAKVLEAGGVVAGGHTVNDDRVKFGLAVTGICRDGQFFHNRGAQAGDLLILTKPIGTGLWTTAYRAGLVTASEFNPTLLSMSNLNAHAMRVGRANRDSVHAVTDVSGFGLIGHASELARASNVTLVLESERLPLYDGVLELAKRGLQTTITAQNMNYYAARVRMGSTVAATDNAILHDPQTSGGLLLAVSGDQGNKVCADLHLRGVDSAIIGHARARIAGVDVLCS